MNNIKLIVNILLFIWLFEFCCTSFSYATRTNEVVLFNYGFKNGNLSEQLPRSRNLLANKNGASGGCTEMLNTFAAFSANFTYCAIRNARPINLCTKCVSYYITLGVVYNEILQYPDSDGQCRDRLFNLDRLQVVDSGFNYVTGLWKRASCDSCFKTNTAGGPSSELTDVVAKIINASAVLTNCVTTHRNESLKPDTETCDSCIQDYQRINELYNNLKADTGEISFCMDIVDLINITRNEWSGELGCCKDRKKPEYLFLLSSAAISMLPLLFYFLAYVFTSKKKHPIVQQSRWNQQSEGKPSPSSEQYNEG